MKFFQFSIKQIMVLITLTALVIAVWQWKLRPSNADRLQQALLKSVEQSDVDSVKRTIGLGADVNHWSMSLLSVAVKHMDRPMIDLLLANGADPQRAIMEVLRSGNAKLLDDFVKRGAIPDWNDVKTFINKGDLISLQLLLPHIARVKEPNVGYNLDGNVDAQGWERLLYYAVTAPDSCRHELIEILLKDHPQKSIIALEQAEWTKQLDVIKQLMTHGFRYGLPEMIALGRVDEVQALLQTQPQVVRDQQFGGPSKMGRSGILTLSLVYGHHEISRLLLDAGVPTEGPSNFRDILIFHALSKPNVDVLRQLLDCSAGWYDARNLENGSPLDHLLRYNVGQPECVRLLLEAGVPLNEKVGIELTLAIDGLGRCNTQEYRRQIEIVKILKLAGACQIADLIVRPSIDDYCRTKYGFQNLDELLDSRSLPK